MDGMEKRIKRVCVFLCSPAHNPDCFARHVNDVQPRNRLYEAVMQAWVKRKAGKATSGARGQAQSEKVKVQALIAYEVGHLRYNTWLALRYFFVFSLGKISTILYDSTTIKTCFNMHKDGF
jgi:hypothetical protein